MSLATCSTKFVSAGLGGFLCLSSAALITVSRCFSVASLNCVFVLDRISFILECNVSASGILRPSEGLSILYYSLSNILHKECLSLACYTDGVLFSSSHPLLRGAASEHVLRFWARESGVVIVVAYLIVF